MLAWLGFEGSYGTARLTRDYLTSTYLFTYSLLCFAFTVCCHTLNFEFIVPYSLFIYAATQACPCLDNES